MRSPSNIITFLSDFGNEDHFVAAVKGEILKINPQVRIIDITHNLEPFDIEAAAYLLEASFANFPSGTVHLVVVDPGVGCREPIILDSGDYLFVGPDNGIFDPIISSANCERFIIEPKRPLSATFHARDLFGPTAAQLSLGQKPDDLGRRADRLIEKVQSTPKVIHIDRFGNLITNLKGKSQGQILIRGQMIPIVKSYLKVNRGELLAIVGSSGRIEISVREGSAQDYLGVERGVEIEYLD
ncbi:MAG TPA: hypothetical protein EYP24_05730 [bacterium (Candidatus Stahlbacteria)]|nr:hypothetical protein [Candidatus Stahlbacteria bacterium]